MNTLAHMADTIPIPPTHRLLPVVCAIFLLAAGCSTTHDSCRVTVTPPEYTSRVHDWMAQASARYDGRAWRDFDIYDVTIVQGKYQIRDGNGGMILVNGNSMGTHASGRYRSTVNAKGNIDKYGVWEALNVLSSIHDGEMRDGQQPKHGGSIRWP